MGFVNKDSFCKVSFLVVNAYYFIMNDFIQIMSRSGQAVMLDCLSTERVQSEYVNGLLREVQVLLTEAVAGSTANGYASHWK